MKQNIEMEKTHIRLALVYDEHIKPILRISYNLTLAAQRMLNPLLGICKNLEMQSH